MRVVFMGTPEFAVPSLHLLARSHEVVAVYTQPDRVRGRGTALVPSPVKAVALELGLPVVQPETLRDRVVVAQLEAFRPDVICVAAFGMLLPPDVLSIPPLGCLNVHASLLPAYRGAAPVHRAILNGDEVAGVVIMQMEEGLDTGPFTNPVEVAVGEHTVESLTAVLADRGAEGLLLTLDRLASGTVVWTPQDPARATHAPKITAEDLHLDPTLTVDQALRRIRVSTSSARSKACVNGAGLSIVTAHRADEHLKPGEVIARQDALLLGFSDGALLAEEVRPEGKASMDGACFARGARLAPACEWTAPE
jgi:methionyl-tRNA formyltransferase